MMQDLYRCFILLLYLYFLKDVTTTENYSWESVVLASLYRELCTTSQVDKIQLVDHGHYYR